MPLAKQHGGAEQMLMHLLRANRKTGCTSYSLAFLSDGPMVREAAELGYSVEVMDAGKIRQIDKFIRTTCQLYKWMKREQLQVVMSWMSKGHVYAGIAAKWAGRPAVWWQHGGSEKDSWLERLIYRIPASGVLCCSRHVAELQAGKTPSLSCKVIYPAVDLEHLDEISRIPVREARNRLGLPQDACIIGVVARLQRWKGIHRFVEAASLAAARHSGLYFVVVGGPHHSEPDYLDELKALAANEQLAGKIRFAGHRQDAPLWMQACDILAHTTTGVEPFGMVIIEGMALKKPVIAAKAGGPLEIIEHGVNGLLAVPDRVDELSDCMLKLVRDRELRIRLGEAAGRKARQYGADRLAREVGEYIDSMASMAEIGINTSIQINGKAGKEL